MLEDYQEGQWKKTLRRTTKEDSRGMASAVSEIYVVWKDGQRKFAREW